MSVTDVRNYIIQYQQPALLLVCNGQTIPNGANTPISFNTALYDELGMWSLADPTKIYTPTDALWHIYFRITWAANDTGRRVAQLSGTLFPSSADEFVALGRTISEHHLYQLTHIDAANDLQITVFQNSGGNLDIAWVHLIMARHVEIAYPI